MQHMHRYVLAHTHDGLCCDGIVEHVDDQCLYMAVPLSPTEGEARAFFGPGFGFGGFAGGFPGYGGYPGFGYPGYGYPPLYPYPFYPRRFYRRAFPLAALLGLSLLPYY